MRIGSSTSIAYCKTWNFSTSAIADGSLQWILLPIEVELM